ncbi:hypothetical protein MAR_015951 [Mya arenaria]|uniref:Uncharacterized protein n=1 Tax=Mya arenaria TaxID=6604 RepID=A0ABY7FK73_MYAAR|nr:hypothetical protein MAR_015951 [Mya arenaria]
MSQIEDHYDSIIDTKPDNDCVAGKTPRECVTEGGYQKQEDTDNDDARGRDTGDEDYVSYCVNDSNVYMTVEVDTSKESHKDDTDLYEEYKTNDSSAPIYEIVDEGAMPIVEESGELIDVQDQDVVRECCRVFVRSVIKCCRERNNRLPLDVYLVNNCPILTSWISEDLAAFSE